MEGNTLAGLSDAARSLVARAHEEARRLGQNYVGTEHLLLALTGDGGTAGRVLKEIGAGPERVRRAVEYIIARGEPGTGEEPRLTPRAWHAIDLGRLEARWQSSEVVEPVHLLLGLIREGEGIAAGVLASIGVDAARVRLAVERAEGGPAGQPGTSAGVPGVWVQTSASVSTSATFQGGATAGAGGATSTGGVARAPGQAAPLRELRRVVPVAQRQDRGGSAVTLTAVELYANGFLAHFWVAAGQPAPSDPATFRHPDLEVEARDDRGGRYLPRPSGGFGDAADWRTAVVFAPAPDPAAADLRLTVPRIRWRRFRPGEASLREEPEEGPWSFTISLAP